MILAAGACLAKFGFLAGFCYDTITNYFELRNALYFAFWGLTPRLFSMNRRGG